MIVVPDSDIILIKSPLKLDNRRVEIYAKESGSATITATNGSINGTMSVTAE